MTEGTLRERFSNNLGKVEVVIYSMLAALLIWLRRNGGSENELGEL
jgi:hypothetical protein